MIKLIVFTFCALLFFNINAQNSLTKREAKKIYREFESLTADEMNMAHDLFFSFIQQQSELILSDTNFMKETLGEYFDLNFEDSTSVEEDDFTFEIIFNSGDTLKSELMKYIEYDLEPAYWKFIQFNLESFKKEKIAEEMINKSIYKLRFSKSPNDFNYFQYEMKIENEVSKIIKKEIIKYN